MLLGRLQILRHVTQKLLAGVGILARQPVEADARECDQADIGDGFGRSGLIGTFDEADHVARQQEVPDMTAAVAHMAAQAHGAVENLVNLAGAVALIEDGIVGPVMLARARPAWSADGRSA